MNMIFLCVKNHHSVLQSLITKIFLWRNLMPYRKSRGKMNPETKAALINTMLIGTNYHCIVINGEVHKINVKEILDERPDL
ncbi:hypothetical protein RaK2_00201 [Klebsiella phage vB_KleM_RaK2]|uniref:Uncharacterized protein n=2 Tax=Alcyoneusvirus TaxID=2560086 RepID=H6X408_9CAUD|nr:hypothetical protein F403_gp334 [Klebsiella phage vB_KleM_RaK2]AFA44474.1 hypothetical protein RaK2_00201 [Klebsiella phage vB_KleM_RaK2]